MNLKTTSIFILSCISFQLFAQETPKDWHLLDKGDDNIPGISLAKAYELLKENKKTSTTVVVAVLDAGLDIKHEDIEPVLWTNPKEIAGNNLDDDNNGYPDDVHGWNFIGGKDGKSIEAETLELTRLYRKYKEQFKDKNKFNITPEEKEDYNEYLKFMKLFNDGKNKLASAIKSNKEEFEYFDKLIPPLQKAVGKNSFTEKQLKKQN